MILDEIVLSTRGRVERAKPKAARSFREALSAAGLSFICEVKKASPSKGVIAGDFPYLDIARDYEAAGAAAISVLTEPDFFLGSDDYLREIARTVSVPVLRKDFVIDPFQIYEAKGLGASAVLLIAALLDLPTLREFIALAASLGLDSLVEAHDETELTRALDAGAEIIGVNNRNLLTFEVDLRTSIALRSRVPAGILFVAESGIRGADDIAALSAAGVDAVLIGETLMRERDKKSALAALKNGAADAPRQTD